MKLLDLNGYFSTFPANDAEEGFVEVTNEEFKLIRKAQAMGSFVTVDFSNVVTKEDEDYSSAVEKYDEAVKNSDYINQKNEEASGFELFDFEEEVKKLKEKINRE